MSITVRRTNGKKEVERPGFTFHDTTTGTYSAEQITSRIVEDMRNVLEQIRDKQMLQCDVRADIKRMRIALERIAQNFPAKKGRPRK